MIKIDEEEKLIVYEKLKSRVFSREIVREFLELTYLPYTPQEIYDFFYGNLLLSNENNLSISDIKIFLEKLADTRQIQEFELPNSRIKYYLADEGNEKKEINLDLIGNWSQHIQQDFFLDPIKNLNFDGKIENKFNIFYGVTMINYLDIPKIVSIDNLYQNKKTFYNNFRDNSRLSEFKEGLRKRDSIILSPPLLYFNRENIELKAKEDDISKNWHIKIPYTLNRNKQGLIINGQQRMLAIDLINLGSIFLEFKEPISCYGPVSVIIGDLQLNSALEYEFLKKFDTLTGSSQKLSESIKQALINSKYLKSKKKEIIEKIIRALDNDKKSPFFQEIDHSIKSFNIKGSIVEKNGSSLRLFPKKSIFDMINDIIQDLPFFFSDYLIFEKNIERYIDFLIDYFTAIKCVFSQEWVDIYSVIRRNVGIFAIGKLISSIWSNSLNRLNSDDRMLRIIESLLSWKNNIKFIDLSSDSILNHQFPEELKRNVNIFYRFFLRVLLDSLYDNQMLKKEAKNMWIEFKNINII